MCGIVLSYSENQVKREKFISQGLDLISHRGQDDKKIIHYDNLSLGHRRLKITGNTPQPITQGKIVSMSNGEFYDYENIILELGLQKNEFGSDAEILIPLYKKHGINGMMPFLNGEFVFTIIDKEENKIYLVRDLMGNKTLYYQIKGKELFVSSEVKSFKSIDKLKFNNEVLFQKMSMQYHHPKNSLFEDIHQLEPGSILIYDYKSNTYTIEYYDDIYKKEEKRDINQSELFNILKESVERRIKNQNPAITLSGGLDSSIILDLVQEINPNINNCFSVSFKDGSFYDESDIVKKISKKYGTNLNILELTQKDLMDAFEESVYHAEDVAVNLHISAKYLLFKKIKQEGFNVSLSGEGSDELFFGYAHFYPVVSNYLKGMHLPDVIDEKTQHLPMFIQAKLSIGNKIKSFLNISEDFHFEDTYNISHLHEMEKASFLWSKYALSNSLLVALGDKQEMASTVEGRTPFLDKNLVKYITSVDISNKINPNEDKYLLREIFRNRLLPEVVEKKKHPFISPPLLDSIEGIEFYRKILNEWDYPLLNKVKINHKLDELINETLEEKRLFDPVFMILSSLALIQKRMIDD